MAIDISFKDAWSGLADCGQCAMRDVSLFAGLDSNELKQMGNPIHNYKFKPGSVLYRTNEKGHELFTVRSGMLKLERYLPDGNKRIVRLVKANDVFGMETLVNSCYQHDAVVLEEADICKLPVELVQELSSKNPILHKELMIRWQSALSEADDWLTDLLSGAARQRVARLLLKLNRGQVDCHLLTREDMGAMLSITTETASRIIAEFKRKGLLEEISSNRFRCELTGLIEIAEM